MLELLDSYGNLMHRGFYSDKNKNLIHIQEDYVECDIIGTYILNEFNTSKFRFGNNKKPEKFKTSNLTPIDNVYAFVRDNNWAHKDSWTKHNLDLALTTDSELDLRDGRISA